jgi:hypothetical protein
MNVARKVLLSPGAMLMSGFMRFSRDMPYRKRFAKAIIARLVFAVILTAILRRLEHDSED